MKWRGGKGEEKKKGALYTPGRDECFYDIQYNSLGCHLPWPGSPDPGGTGHLPHSLLYGGQEVTLHGSGGESD